ncbi:uncharacterized protein LOC115455292 isoform X2 [Manduca sexta]|uniref:uncharacterized protein LOC115455292 isoform X2 n=1 Tax=Manduca sexta TaxID=7130 RepID=UPI00118221EC|nr:uncharacterized protein LOC115455292 isoform X2 [Manduca sexta]
MDRNVDRIEDVMDTVVKVCMAFMVVLITVIIFSAEPKENSGNQELLKSVEMLYTKFSVVLEYKERFEELLMESYWYHAISEGRLKYIVESRLVTRQRLLFCQNQLQSLQMKYDKLQEDYHKLSQEMEALKNITRLD